MLHVIYGIKMKQKVDIILVVEECLAQMAEAVKEVCDESFEESSGYQSHL